MMQILSLHFPDDPLRFHLMKAIKTIYKMAVSSPVGKLELFATDEAMIAVVMEQEKNSSKMKALQNAKIGKNKILLKAEKQLKEYFTGKRTQFTVPLAFEGSPFQNRVWSELQKISYGSLRSYQDHSKKVLKPHAHRAVGSAIGRNPLPLFIPCHRVVGGSGLLSGYSGGLAVKARLLRLEGHEVSPSFKILSE